MISENREFTHKSPIGNISETPWKSTKPFPERKEQNKNKNEKQKQKSTWNGFISLSYLWFQKKAKQKQNTLKKQKKVGK